MVFRLGHEVLNILDRKKNHVVVQYKANGEGAPTHDFFDELIFACGKKSLNFVSTCSELSSRCGCRSKDLGETSKLEREMGIGQREILVSPTSSFAPFQSTRLTLILDMT